jgi:hypothetical protein
MMMDTSDIREIMEEAPGGPNHGRAASNNPEGEGRWVDLSESAAQAAEFMRDGGFIVGSMEGGAQQERAGITSHRGVLRGDEYVDGFRLRDLVEENLGFSYAEISAVYRPGRLTADQRELRARIDARLLALSRAGGNMDALARVLRWDPKTMDGALARARAAS